MPRACYRHAVATLQVKNLPDELHARLRHRADEDGVTLSEYVTRLLRRDLDRPSMRQWLAERAGRPPRPDVDVVSLLDEVRDSP